MAKLSSNSIFGNVSGSIGEVVFSSWKGIPYVRAKAVSVKNPKSDAQLDQRIKFTAIIIFLKALTVFLRVGFKNDKIPMSPFNAAMSYNLLNALTGSYPDYELDYSKVRVSQGYLPGVLNPEVKSTSSGDILFTWEDNSFETDSRADDSVLLVVYNSIKQQAVFTVDGYPRYSRRQVISLPEIFEGDEVQCYIAYQNQRQTVFSNSQFVGEIRI